MARRRDQRKTVNLKLWATEDGRVVVEVHHPPDEEGCLLVHRHVAESFDLVVDDDSGLDMRDAVRYELSAELTGPQT